MMTLQAAGQPLVGEMQVVVRELAALGIAAEESGPAIAAGALEVGACAGVVSWAGPSHEEVDYAVEDSD